MEGPPSVASSLPPASIKYSRKRLGAGNSRNPIVSEGGPVGTACQQEIDVKPGPLPWIHLSYEAKALSYLGKVRKSSISEPRKRCTAFVVRAEVKLICLWERGRKTSCCAAKKKWDKG